MRKRRFQTIFAFLCSFILIFSNLTSVLASENKLPTKNTESSYIIGLKDNVVIDDFLEKRKLTSKKYKKGKKLKFISMQLTEQEANELAKDESVKYVEADSVVSVEKTDKSQNNKKDSNDKQISPWGIRAIGADIAVESSSIKGKKVKIAVLDTGIASHEDLNVEGGVSFVDYTESPVDDNGHGTHVAGIIAASDNEYGVYGVAPEAELYSIKVLDRNGNGNYSSVIQGIEWAIENHMDIISMSFGGNAYSKALEDAIKLAYDSGILIVASAGNKGLGDETETYPALFPQVISVGAVTKSYSRATFSSTGAELDIVAPGTDIVSTYLENNYKSLSGTSMAAPHVTGAAALLWSIHKNWTNEQVKNRLLETATNLGNKQEYGHGLVNVAKALGIIDREIPPVEEGSSEKGLSDINTINGELKTLADKMVALKDNALDSGDITKAKKIEQQYNQFLAEARSLYKLPDELTNKTKEEFAASQSDIENYLSGKVNELNELIKKYNNAIEEINGSNSENVSSAADYYYTGSPGSSYTRWLYGGQSDYYTIYPNTSGTMTISLSVPSNSDFDLQVTENGSFVASSVAGTGSSESITLNVKNGYVYQVRVYYYSGQSGQYTLSLSSITPNITYNQLYLNVPDDVSLSSNESKVYQFTPSSSGQYKFFTGPYGGYGSSNDTVLEIYSDSALTNRIAYNDDANGTLFSEISINLTGGVTYYIKLRPYGSGSLFTRMMVTKEIVFTDLYLNSPQDISLPTGEFKAFRFTPPSSGTYAFYTSPYASNGTSNDTVLELYSDANLTNQLAYNDDYNGLFSRIEINLSAGVTYYLKLRPYGSGAVYARLTAEYVNKFTNISGNYTEDLTLSNNQYKYYMFEPSTTGFYKIQTGSYANNGTAMDTELSLYSDESLTSLLKYSDDLKHPTSSSFSKIYHYFQAGQKYYIKVGGYQGISGNFRFSLSYLPDTDGDGLPDEVEINGIGIGSKGSYNKTVTTDPYEVDTDGDALLDGVELLELKYYDSTNDYYEAFEDPTNSVYGSMVSGFYITPPSWYDWSSDDVPTLKQLLTTAEGFKDVITAHSEYVKGFQGLLSQTGNEEIELYLDQLSSIGLNYYELTSDIASRIEELGTTEDQQWLASQYSNVEYVAFRDFYSNGDVYYADVEPYDPNDAKKPTYAWLGTAAHKAIESVFETDIGSKARTEYIIPNTIPKQKLDMAYDSRINNMGTGEANIWEIKPFSQHRLFNYSMYKKNVNQLSRYITAYERYWGKSTSVGTYAQWHRSHQFVQLPSPYSKKIAYYYQFDDPMEKGFVYYIVTDVPNKPDPNVVKSPVGRKYNVTIQGQTIQVEELARKKKSNQAVAYAIIGTAVIIVVGAIVNDAFVVGVADDGPALITATQLIRSGISILRSNPAY